MKAFYALTLQAILISTVPSLVWADDAPISSAPTCEGGDPTDSLRSKLSPELLALSGTVFMKICGQLRGAIVNAGDSRLENTLMPPAHPRNADGFYPAEEVLKHHQGTVIIAIVVEPNCKVSWAGVLKSSGYPALDAAALKWAVSTSFKSPGYLNSKPVRVYTTTNVTFGLNGSH
jgi:TonB family protein